METYPCPHCSPYPSPTDKTIAIGLTDFVAVTEHGKQLSIWADRIRKTSVFIDPRATICPGCKRSLEESTTTDPTSNLALAVLLRVQDEKKEEKVDRPQFRGFHIQMVGSPQRWHPDNGEDPVGAILDYPMYHDCGMGHIVHNAGSRFTRLFRTPSICDPIHFHCTGCRESGAGYQSDIEVPLRKLFVTLESQEVHGLSGCNPPRTLKFTFISKKLY